MWSQTALPPPQLTGWSLAEDSHALRDASLGTVVSSPELSKVLSSSLPKAQS